MENFESWIGKTDVQHDICSTRPVHMMQALLNQTSIQPVVLPHLYHWCYFLPIVDHQTLAEDGHPRKGNFLPPIPFPKRMWAGGRLQFIQPIQIDQALHRESEIKNIQFKQGKSGSMYFVTVEHRLFADDQLCIIEEHDIVYREASNKLTSIPTAIDQPQELRTADYRHHYHADTVALFRYSAATFNGHKIHYDRNYCIEQEGYPGLVVHGPLLATLLLHFFKHEYPAADIKTFNFRALKPVFDFQKFNVCGVCNADQAEVWIEHLDGSVAMQAELTLHGGA